MTDEKRQLFDKINASILKKKGSLIKKLPSVHTIEDGIIIRFFTDWDECVNDIKYKKIIDNSKPEDIVIFYYLPKGSVIELKQRDYIHCMLCLSGRIELIFNGKTEILDSYHKMCIDTDTFEGIALENTYVVTSNRK